MFAEVILLASTLVTCVGIAIWAILAIMDDHDRRERWKRDIEDARAKSRSLTKH